MGWLIAFAVVMVYITVFGFMYSAKQADRLSEKHYKELKGETLRDEEF